MSFVTRRVLISNTVFVGIGAVVSDLIALFVLPLFVKNLGADLYGLWIISKIILGYFNLLDFGFTEGLTRYVADARVKGEHDRLSSSVMSGLGLLMVLGLLIGLVVIAFRADIVSFFEIDEPRREVAKGLLLVTGLFSIVLWPQRITRVILRASLRMSEQSLLDTAAALASSIVLLLLVTHSVDIITLAVVDGFVRVLLWIPSVVLAVRYVPQIRWQWRLFSFARIREMSSFSLGMFYSALLTMLTVRLSNLVIAKMISVTAVTSYAVASRLYAFLVQGTQVACATVIPAVYNLTAADDRDRLSRLVHQAVKYRAMLNISVAFLCIAVAPSFIRVWMGPDYVECGRWAQIFLIQHLLVPLGVMPNVLKGMGRVGVVNACTTVRVCVGLTLSLALIPRYGIGGPILGTVIASLALGDVVFFPYFCRVAGLEWRKTFFLYIRILLLNLILAVPAVVMFRIHPLTTWPALVGVSAVFLTLAAGLNYLAFFERQERADLRLVAETLGFTRFLGWARG